MSNKTTISGAAGKLEACASHILEKYQSEGYGVQRIAFEENDNNGILVQMKNSTSTGGGLLRTVTGLSSCATLKLTVVGNDLNVEVMAGKWLEKAGVAVVSWFILWPLFVTAAVGAFRQKSFLDRVYNDTLAWLATNKG